MKPKVIFNSDHDAGTVYIMKVLDEDASDVWKYFTESDLLEKWWAPAPWETKTLNMNFGAGGRWDYVMRDPENNRQNAGLIFHEVNVGRSFDFTDFMADENGNINTVIPQSNWLVGFTGVEEGTKLTLNIHFNSEEEMKKVMDMGFEERVLKSLDQLEKLMIKKD